MAKRLMSLLVVMTMMLSLLCGTVFATEVTESEAVYDQEGPIPEADAVVPDAAVAFRNALAAGGNATLSESVTVLNAHAETDLNVVTNESNINFGDNTFTLDVSGVYANPNWKGLDIRSGNVTINGNNGGITIANTIEEGNLLGNLYAIYVGSDSTSANVTITGGNYVGGCTAVHVKKGMVTILGGTFQSNEPGWTLNCTDNSGSTITVKGGKFYKFNPAKANYDPEFGYPGGDTGIAQVGGSAEVIVPEGYEVVQNGDWYEVVETEAHRFRDALAYGGTVSLSKDVTETSESMDAANIITRNTNVDFGTHTFTLDTGNVANWAALRVQFGNVTLSGTTGGIRVANTADGGANIGELYAVLVGTKSEDSNPVVTITGGNYIGGTSAVSVTKGTLKITGGYFEALTSNKTYTINCIDEYYRDGSANVEISGGTFVGYNPDNSASENPRASFIVDGYKSVESKDSQGRTIYTVVCAHKSLAGYPHKESTYVEEGCQAYYECNNCHKLFMDAAATQEVADKADLVIPVLIEIKGTEAVVSDAAVLGAIQKSEDSAVVELPVLETNKTVKEVTVPVASVEAVAEQDKGLLIETSDVTVTLDAKTVATVAEEAKDATSVTIEVTKEETKILNTAQKEAVKNKEVEVVISAKILADGKEISDFKGGKVTVEIPFKPAEGLKASDYKFVYIDDNGKVTEIPSKYFDGVMVVELEHFSEYAIVRDVPVTNEGGTGSVPEAAPAPAPAPAAPVKDNTPKTGAISVIGLVSAMAVGGLVLTRKRK